jgi:hypothetical protein
MKPTKPIGIIILTLLLTFAASAQKFKEVDSVTKANVGVSFSIDLESVKKDGESVTFTGAAEGFVLTGEKERVALPNYRIVSTISASCKTFIWNEHTRKGQWGEDDGVPRLIDEKDAVKNRDGVTESDPIWKALTLACGERKTKLSAYVYH